MSFRLEHPTVSANRAEKATLFVQGDFGFGFRKILCRWIEWEERPYAQYAHAIHVRFVPKGGRSVRGFVKHGIDRPFVILAGWNVPDLTASDWELVREDESVRVQQVRHTSFSPAWEREFDAGLERYLARGGRVVLDARSSLSTDWSQGSSARRGP